MGLDNFRTDDKSDQSDSGSTSSGTNNNDSSSNSNDSSHPEYDIQIPSSGTLDPSADSNDETTSTPHRVKAQIDKDIKDRSLGDVNRPQLNKLSISQRVVYIRDNYMPDYYPEHQVEDGWQWVEVAKIRCVCGQILIADPQASCTECEREYVKTDRSVNQKHILVKNNEH